MLNIGVGVCPCKPERLIGQLMCIKQLVLQSGSFSCSKRCASPYTPVQSEAAAQCHAVLPRRTSPGAVALTSS